MKTHIVSLLLGCLAPAIVLAQPTVSTNEYYHIGDIINMVKCNTDGIAAGASGSGVSWDFSALTPSGGIATTTVAANTSSEFITSNLMITLPDGSTEYMKENNTDSYVDAIVKTVTYSYNNFYLVKRPVTYSSNVVDTYRVITTSPAMEGTGIVTQSGDGYGTLKLPTGTYNYVLRIKRNISEKDSVDNSFSGFKNTTTYMWFDTSHSAPLLRIDSVTDVTGTVVSAMYLAPPTAVKDVNNTVTNIKGYLENSTLSLTGNFEHGKAYDVVMYNIIGMKVLKEKFTGGVDRQQFEVNKQLVPGIYMVNVSEEANVQGAAIIKVVKQ